MRREGAWLCLLTLALVHCGPTSVPYGVLIFTGSRHSTRGIDATVRFLFDPTQCGSGACTTSSIAYVQIVRIIDLATENILAPASDQTNRVVTGTATAAFNGIKRRNGVEGDEVTTGAATSRRAHV